MEFKTVTTLKTNWLKNATENGGAFKMVLDSKEPGNVVVNMVSVKHGRMWSDVNNDTLLKLVEKDNGIYEVITNYPHKLYFDIDKQNVIDNDIYYNKIVSKINELFPGAVLAVSGSITSAKTSYHIIVSNYLIKNINDRNNIKIICQYLKQNFDDGFDDKVYTNNRNMKCINQSKGDKRIQKIIMNDDIKAHLITTFITNENIELPAHKFNIESNYSDIALYIDVEKSRNKLNLGSLPKLKPVELSKEFNYKTCSNIEILNALPLTPSFSHEYTHRVARFCFNNNIPFDSFINWYSFKSTTDNNINRWTYNWSILHKFPPFSRENALLILVHYYPNIRRTAASIKFQELFNLSSENIIKINRLDNSAFNKIKKDKHIIKNKIKKDTDIIKNELNLINDDKYLFNFNKLNLNNEYIYKEPLNKNELNIINDEYINKKQLNINELNIINDEIIYKKTLNNIKTDTHIIKNNSKFTVINLGMGEGKTAQTIDYLKNVNSFLWITPNQALAYGTTSRIIDAGILDIKHYQLDFKTKDDRIANIPQTDKLICCLNSLHYINDKTYDVVIIDESETVLAKWFNNSTLTVDFKNESWRSFINVIQQCKNCIMLDAFTSKITVEFIKSLNGDTSLTIYEKPITTSDRIVEFVDTYELWLNGIIEDLKANKTLFIFYPYLRKNNKYPAMEELKLKLEELTNTIGISYNSQVDDKVIKTLKDVNETWINYKFILTNTKITVGVNFDLQHFDKVYLSMAGFSSTRDIIQVSCRCRKLNTNIIKVCYFEKYNTVKAFINDSDIVINCPVYKKLVTNILIEKMAPLKGSFLLFCEKAGYKIKINKEVLDAKLSEYITNLFIDSDIEYSFSTIPDISNIEVDEIQKKTYALNSTLEEKLSLQKYYFKNKFIDGADVSSLCLGWDNRYNLFFDKIANFKFDDEHILLKNVNYNKWSHIFPDDKQLNNIKMNDDIIDGFFNNFHYVNLNKKSCKQAILKNSYNTYFCKKIITSSKGKHAQMEIADEIKELYMFAINNLKIYKNNDSNFIVKIKTENKLDYDIFED